MKKKRTLLFAVILFLFLLGFYKTVPIHDPNPGGSPAGTPVESEYSSEDPNSTLPGLSSADPPVPVLTDLSTKYARYVIYEDKCRIRNYDYNDSGILKKYFDEEAPLCPKKAKPFIFVSKLDMAAGHSCIGFDDTVFNDSYGGDIERWNCSYKEITRNFTGKFIDRHFDSGETKEFEIDDCPTEEYVWIRCEQPGTNASYEQPLMLPSVKPVAAPILPSNLGRKPLHVLVLGVDSISRLNAHRQFSKTLKFLQSKKNSIELFGYNKIGLNSAPNQISLLTGSPFSDPGLRKRVDTEYFDNQTRFLWEDYEARGYRTMHYEEKHPYGLFVYPTLMGFKKTPTTYWPRPMIQAIEDSSLREAGDHRCIGPHFPAKHYLDYTYGTMRILGNNRPLFSYQFLVEVAHDDLNGGRRIDGYLEDFFTKLESGGILNNTAVFFIADHGFRFGSFRKTPLGRYEDMLPYGFVLMPDAYYEEYPEALKNIQVNSRRLVSVFDLHATLLELVDPWGEGRLIRTANGYSILSNKIPSNRSCADAGINFQFCACFEPQSYDRKSNLSQSLAAFIISEINNIILENNATSECRKWSLDAVEEFVRLSEGSRWTYYFRSSIKTKPAAQFEVTAQFIETDRSWKLLSDIDRTSRFSTHAKCVKRLSHERYCYCK